MTRGEGYSPIFWWFVTKKENIPGKQEGSVWPRREGGFFSADWGV